MDFFAALKAFVAVVEDGGFAKAARRMSVVTSSVTRQVNALEEHLGTQLLNRSTRSVTLTDAGESYYAQASRILGDLEEANRSISEADGLPRGLLRVSLPVAFGRLHVAPAISEFLRACPDIELDLMMTDSVVNLVEERVDVAIRIGRLESSSLGCAQDCSAPSSRMRESRLSCRTWRTPDAGRYRPARLLDLLLRQGTPELAVCRAFGNGRGACKG